MVDKYDSIFTNLLSKSSLRTGKTNSFFRAARIYGFQTIYRVPNNSKYISVAKSVIAK